MKTAVKSAISPLGTLILAWLLVHRNGGTPNQIDKALQAVVQQRWTAAERKKALDEEITALAKAGSIEHRRRSAYALTDRGRRAALEALGVASIPKDITWSSIKKVFLFARALEVPTPKLSSTPAIRSAAVLGRHHGISVGPDSTLKELKHKLAWKLLGVESAAPFTAGAVIEALLNQALGTKEPLPYNQIVVMGAARAIGSMRSSAEEIQRIALSRWVQRIEAVPAATAPERAAPERATKGAPAKGAAHTELPASDSAFAERVLAAARASKTGRFGDDKVFISHVIQQLDHEGVAVGDVNAFKERLVSVHRKRLLSLSRADLVEVMAKGDVDPSETRYLNATFHFVGI